MYDPSRMTIQNIQFLRGLSALLVVMFHLGPVYERIGIPQFGGGGVDVFFVISGFIMAHTSAQRPVSAAAFMRARVRRIVPLYWTVTSFVFCLAFLAPGLMKRPHSSWGEFTQSLFFVPYARDGALVDPILFLGWTLNYEMFFYLMFALGLTLPKKFSKCFTMGSIIALVGFGGLLDPVDPVAKFYTHPIMLEFCFGMLVAIVYDWFPREVSRPLRALFMVVAALGLALVVIIPVVWRDVGRAWLSGLPALMLVASCVALERSGLRMNSSLFLLMGASSYSLYLTHIFITEVMVKAANWLMPGLIGALLIVGFGAAGALWLGVAVYRLLELPLQKLDAKVRCKSALASISR